MRPAGAVVGGQHGVGQHLMGDHHPPQRAGIETGPVAEHDQRRIDLIPERLEPAVQRGGLSVLPAWADDGARAAEVDRDRHLVGPCAEHHDELAELRGSDDRHDPLEHRPAVDEVELLRAAEPTAAPPASTSAAITACRGSRVPRSSSRMAARMYGRPSSSSSSAMPAAHTSAAASISSATSASSGLPSTSHARTASPSAPGRSGWYIQSRAITVTT